LQPVTNGSYREAHFELSTGDRLLCRRLIEAAFIRSWPNRLRLTAKRQKAALFLKALGPDRRASIACESAGMRRISRRAGLQGSVATWFRRRILATDQR
jgi:hypothetical protein